MGHRKNQRWGLPSPEVGNGWVGPIEAEELDKQLTLLAQQQALSLFGELATDLQKYGADAAMIAEVQRNMAIIEHTLKMVHYQTEIAILEATGKLSADQLAVLHKAIDFVASIDPTKFLTGGTPVVTTTTTTQESISHPGTWVETTTTIVDMLARARDLLKKYKDQGLDPFTLKLREINQDFTDIRAALGDTPEVMQEYNEAIQRATEEAYSSLTEFYQSLMFGPDSGQSVSQQYDSTTAEFARIAAEIAGGDYSELDDLAGVGQTLIDLAGQMFGTSTQGFQGIREQIMAQIAALLAQAGLPVPQLPTAPNLANQSGLANVLQFPGSSSGSGPNRTGGNLTIKPQGSDSRLVVDSTDRVASVVSLTSGKQEKILTLIATKMDELKTAIEESGKENPNTMSKNWGYGKAS